MNSPVDDDVTRKQRKEKLCALTLFTRCANALEARSIRQGPVRSRSDVSERLRLSHDEQCEVRHNANEVDTNTRRKKTELRKTNTRTKETELHKATDTKTKRREEHTRVTTRKRKLSEVWTETTDSFNKPILSAPWTNIYNQ